MLRGVFLLSAAAAWLAIAILPMAPACASAANPPRTEKHAETVLYSFGSTGGAPETGVIADAGGTLYGTAVGGGPAGWGSVFALIPGRQGYTEQDLYDFCKDKHCSDGARPSGGLVRTKDGSFYGVAFIGGESGCYQGCGLVFRLKPGTSGYKEIVLYKFTGNADGGMPFGTLVLQPDGTIAGAATFGGLCELCGTVFALTPSKSGYVETTLHSFAGGADGGGPNGVTQDKTGIIYGTTNYDGGGAGCGNQGCGTLYALVPGNGTYTENIVHVFEGGSDGASPISIPTVDGTSGDITGTTSYGGGSNCGVVYRFTPSNGGYSESILHDFGGSGGCGPWGPVLVESDRSIFGTTINGGTGDNGTVFMLKGTQSGYTLKTLYSFAGPPDGDDPEFTALIRDATGTLYGTTVYGGAYCLPLGCGTVFQLVP
jgi:uncharacterized repeat protein (TIGR03803 family)